MGGIVLRSEGFTLMNRLALLAAALLTCGNASNQFAAQTNSNAATLEERTLLYFKQLLAQAEKAGERPDLGALIRRAEERARNDGLSPASNRPAGRRTELAKRGTGSAVDFVFPGGNPSDFVAAVDKSFNAEWSSIATIPPEMIHAMVPKIRVRIEDTDQLLGLYNRLGEENPALGKWVWMGPAAAPNVLMLVPGKSGVVTNLPEPEVEVRVFHIRWVSGTNLATLAQAVTLADEAAQQTARKEGRKPIPGRVVVDQRTASVIVSATPESMATVSQLISSLDIPNAEPPDDGELLRAFYLDKRPLCELADEPGRSYKAIESHMTRLRRKVKENLLTWMKSSPRKDGRLSSKSCAASVRKVAHHCKATSFDESVTILSRHA